MAAATENPRNLSCPQPPRSHREAAAPNRWNHWLHRVNGGPKQCAAVVEHRHKPIGRTAQVRLRGKQDGWLRPFPGQAPLQDFPAGAGVSAAPWRGPMQRSGSALSGTHSSVVPWDQYHHCGGEGCSGSPLQRVRLAALPDGSQAHLEEKPHLNPPPLNLLRLAGKQVTKKLNKSTERFQRLTDLLTRTLLTQCVFYK
jgi:hypothetical protein